MTIVPFNTSYAEELAKLHIQGIKTGFISTLGLGFVTELYKNIAESESCFGLIELEGNVVIGYVTVSSNLRDLYNRTIFKEFYRFIPFLLTKIFSLKTVKNILETLRYSRNTKKLNLPEAELLSIVVSKPHQGKGIAKRLLQEAFKECIKRNIREIKVLVDATNKYANALYAHNGFEAIDKISSHGVLSNIYLSAIDKKESTRFKANKYIAVLAKQGRRIFSIEGIDWFEYNNFLVPAYLPHCLPAITSSAAQAALTYAKAFFVRWESNYGNCQPGEWWNVIREKPWSLQECSANTRSKVRRGRKKFHAEIVTPEVVESKGYELCKKACTRYGSIQFLPNPAMFRKKVLCAQTYPENFHFFGLFSGDELVAYSENYVQENAVLWESIWYDPEYLRYYSSYALIDAMLNHYLNRLKMLYVSDGSRNIYHKTNVQDFLIDKFDFMKKYSVLNIKYSPIFKKGLSTINYLDFLFSPIKSIIIPKTFHRIEALQLQEKIRKSYLN